MRSVNATLAHLGRQPLPEEVVAGYVGDGAALLVQRALGLVPDRSLAPPSPQPPEEQALAARALEYFLAYYAEHKLDATTLYPGVAEGLAALDAVGLPMAVLSNKPVRPSQQILAGLGVAERFGAVYGGNSFAQKKPDPIGLETLLRENRVKPRAAAMIGDSAVDVRTGRNAGTWTWGVTYGFAPATLQLEPPDWMADSFAELTQQLLK